MGSILIATDEVSEGYREAEMVGVEGINSEGVLKSHHDDREAKRIKPSVEERKLVRQWRQLHALLLSDPLELHDDFRFDIHAQPTHLLRHAAWPLFAEIRD